MNIFGIKGYFVLLFGDLFVLMLFLGKRFIVFGCLLEEICESLKIYRCLGINFKDFEFVF